MSSYPAKSRYRGAVAETYNRLRATSPRWEHEQQLIQGLIGRFPTGTTVLDVPLGTGRFLDHYGRCGLMAYGLDISSDMLNEALRGEILPEGMLQADTERIPLRDKAVDYVVCARLLNWVPMPVFEMILSEFRRVARKGVLVEVRVTRSLGTSELVRSLGADVASNPRALASSVMRTARVGLISKLRATKRMVFRQAGSSAVANSQGYVVHGIEEVNRVFADEGLEIESCEVIDQRRSYIHRIIQPFIVYMLKPAVTPERVDGVRDHDA